MFSELQFFFQKNSVSQPYVTKEMTKTTRKEGPGLQITPPSPKGNKYFV